MLLETLHAIVCNRTRQLACLLVMLVFVLAAPPARADYDPGVTWLERVHELHVRANATYVQTTQFLLRIDTEAAVEENAERRIRYSGSLETLDVLEAWTITPDGRRVVVAPDRIRTMESTDEGRAEFSGQKVRVVIFPAVTAGARLYLRYCGFRSVPS